MYIVERTRLYNRGLLLHGQTKNISNVKCLCGNLRDDVLRPAGTMSHAQH